jgi:hypothetical protein
MPHDKKGHLIEVGDHLKFEVCERYDYARQAWEKRVTIGRATAVMPGSERCNIQVVHLTPGYFPIKPETLTAKETELVLKADGSELVDDGAEHGALSGMPIPAAAAGDEGDPTVSGFARIGAMLVIAVVALAALCTPAFAQAPEPPCGTKDKAAACASLTTGVVTVATRGERREYATFGAAVEAPLGAGFAAFAHVDAFGMQDGASINGTPQTFRSVKIDAGIGRTAGAFVFNARGGLTYSIEGAVGAPIDPRMFDALLEASLPLDGGGHLAIRGGHDGAVGGWAAGADVEIPVAGGPAIVARYEFPFARDPSGRVPWVVTAGGRINVKSFRLKLR